jgi:hypothetical protein
MVFAFTYFLVLKLPDYSETTQKQNLRVTYLVMSMCSHCIHDILALKFQTSTFCTFLNKSATSLQNE